MTETTCSLDVSTWSAASFASVSRYTSASAASRLPPVYGVPALRLFTTVSATARGPPSWSAPAPKGVASSCPHTVVAAASMSTGSGCLPIHESNSLAVLPPHSTVYFALAFSRGLLWADAC
eukprot:4933580-Prymnesium_polylepis.1